MQEELIERVLREVQKRLPTPSASRPTALLVGKEPSADLGWQYVEHGGAAVVIGSMDAFQLLNFPDEQSLAALLEGKPVYLWEGGLEYRRYAAVAERGLWTRLLSAERQLRQWGVRLLRAPGDKLLTAQEVRRLLDSGQPVTGRLTPLARDILEGRQ